MGHPHSCTLWETETQSEESVRLLMPKIGRYFHGFQKYWLWVFNPAIGINYSYPEEYGVCDIKIMPFSQFNAGKRDVKK